MQPTPIFLFSLPRAGSTLCQRILGAHDQIATVSEPHILLPLLYSLKADGVFSEYHHRRTVGALQQFYTNLPNGVESYRAELRKLIVSLYAQTQAQSVPYFVDKTPYYCLIVEEIFQLFPDARFIFLWRHPLAVVASILNFDKRPDTWQLAFVDALLYKGLANLIAAYQHHAQHSFAFSYEAMLHTPVDHWQRLFAYLELPFDPQLLQNFAEVQLTGTYQDPSVNWAENQYLRQANLDKWKHSLDNPLRKAWGKRYLHWIGRERLAVMGYDLDQLLQEVNALSSSRRRLFSDLYRMPLDALGNWCEFALVQEKLAQRRRRERSYAHL